MANQIFCTCGERRTGEGAQKGRYLYYRCTQRVYTYPLPTTCKEVGINAKLADKIVWNKIAELMSSLELLSEQILYWSKNKITKNESSVCDVEYLKKEIAKLENQQARYNQAYGAEVFTLEELKNHTEPIKEKINNLKLQIVNNTLPKTETGNTMPSQKDIESFASENIKALENLSFEEKRGIMMDVIDKIIGTKHELQINGHIPIISPYVKYQTIHRHRRTPKRW